MDAAADAVARVVPARARGRRRRRARAARRLRVRTTGATSTRAATRSSTTRARTCSPTARASSRRSSCSNGIAPRRGRAPAALHRLPRDPVGARDEERAHAPALVVRARRGNGVVDRPARAARSAARASASSPRSIAAVYPNLWAPDGQLQAETLSMFATVAILLLAYRYWQQPSWRRLVARRASRAASARSRARS